MSDDLMPNCIPNDILSNSDKLELISERISENRVWRLSPSIRVAHRRLHFEGGLPKEETKGQRRVNRGLVLVWDLLLEWNRLWRGSSEGR